MNTTPKEMISSDLYRYGWRTGFADHLKAFIQIPGYRFMYYFRRCAYHHKKGGFVS